MVKKPVIYIASYYRAGGNNVFTKFINVMKARKCSKELWKDGFICISPVTLTAFFDYFNGVCNVAIIDDLIEILKRCDAVYVLPEKWWISEGITEELFSAVDADIPVFFDKEKMKEWQQSSGDTRLTITKASRRLLIRSLISRAPKAQARLQVMEMEREG